MCLSVALGIASTVASFAAQQAAANRQNDMYQQNAVTANTDAVEKYAQNQLQQIQEEAKATQERIANKAEVVKARGTTLASTVNGGSSVNSVLNDIERQGAKNDNVTNVNVRNAQVQKLANDTSIKNEAQSRINSVATAEGPDVLATAISGLGNIYDATGGFGTNGTGNVSAKDRKGSVVTNTHA